MADDQNKKMDAVLRDYARRRGGVPGPPLHPATRRMLQDEVRQVYRQPARPSARKWLGLNPGWLFASAAAVVLVLTVAVLRWTPVEQQLAKNEPSLSPRAKDQPARGIADERADLASVKTESLLREEKPAAASRGLSGGALDSNALNQLALQSVPELRQTAAAAEPLPQPAAVAPGDSGVNLNFFDEKEKISDALVSADAADSFAASNRFGGGARKQSESRAVEGAASLGAPVILSASPAPARDLTNLGAAMRTRFVQSNAPPVALLNSFQFEQLGKQIRVVDQDGSIYTGLSEPVSNRTDGAVFFRRYGRVEPADSGATPLFSFTATGTNRTLDRPIVVEGQYFERTNRALPVSATAAPEPAQRAILGRAVIGGTNTVPVRAQSIDR